MPPPVFEWDPLKNESNEDKHDIPFEDAEYVFQDPQRIDVDATRPEHGEQRRIVTGRVGDRVMTVAYTLRGEQIRIISARKARPDERRAYGSSDIR